MIIHVRAKFSCDNCGTEFTVGIDPGYMPPAGWSVFEIAEDAVRGGLDYEDHDKTPRWGSSSVQDEHHLCDRCTLNADAQDQKESA